MSSTGASASISEHPPVGTRIDRNTLELVEVLGTGGYGVVYRAVDLTSRNRQSYAVKCVAGTYDAPSRRHLHMRETGLHQLCSTHPSVVTLHRVVRQRNFTFMIMDYAPDGDLFEQILQQGTYLGRDSLIKHIFLQILDAVQHCHSLGIYHRDLKPENVLCFDQGMHVAITDFGLATTEKQSSEYKTGSIYHMSPECQVSDAKNGETYSPLYNDIWSLGILLLNLTTGRNPWKSATVDDATYREYRNSPRRFLASILPISDELNSVLVRVLAVNWKKRISLSDFREAVASIRTFYSDEVIFDGNLATSIWESGLKKQKKSLVAVSSWPPSRGASQITTLDGLVDEDILCWQPKEKRHVDVAPCHSPVHSIYQYSTRTSSSESESPITPVSDYDPASQACSFVEWDMYPSDGIQEERRYSGEQQKEVSIPVSAFDDDDDDDDEDEGERSEGYASDTSSIFHLSALEIIRKPRETHADNFRTVKRHSSPNTSIYCVTEVSGGFDPAASMRKVDLDDGEHSPRTQPIAIPRNKSKKYIFNPMRFFPRSGGNSWLNRKVRF